MLSAQKIPREIARVLIPGPEERSSGLTFASKMRHPGEPFETSHPGVKVRFSREIPCFVKAASIAFLSSLEKNPVDG